MQCVSRPIVVKKLLFIPAIADPRVQQEDASFHKSATTSTYAIAVFGSQCEGAYVSADFVKKVLGFQVSLEQSGICSTARLTWQLTISQTTETSYLRVVYQLDHDVVFGRRSGHRGWSNSSVNPQPLYSNSSLRMVALVEDLAKLEVSKLDKKFADTAFIKSCASSFGIELEGELAIRAFVGLLRQRVEAIRHSHQSPGCNPLLLAGGATSETTLRSDDVESLVSSGFDEGDLVYEGSTTSSERTWERDFRQPPSFLYGTDRACTQDTYNTPVQAVQVTRSSSPGDSFRSWQLVENASLVATAEDDGPSQTYRAETKEQEENLLDQGQTSDFDMHSGHKEWEWDKDRQRWKRRGRSGLEETDWFPESFA